MCTPRGLEPLTNDAFKMTSQLDALRAVYGDGLTCQVPSYGNYPGLARDALRQDKATKTAVNMISEPSLKYVDTFETLGGNVVFAPTIEEIMDGVEFQVHIRPEDFLLPVCHEGVNRSQVLYLVLNALRAQLAVTGNVRKRGGGVSVPHGAESGFDPYQAYENLDGDNVYGYIHGKILPRGSRGDYLHENFFNVFGLDKQRRPGQLTCEEARRELNSDDTSTAPDEMYARVAADRTAQREDMNALLYDPDNLKSYTGDGGRVIFFTFARAGGIMLKRLLEASPDKDMTGIYIVMLPFPDTISRAGGPGEIEAHFRATGERVTRDHLSCMRHEEVFAFYMSLLRMVVCNEPADAAVAFSGAGSADVPALPTTSVPDPGDLLFEVQSENETLKKKLAALMAENDALKEEAASAKATQDVYRECMELAIESQKATEAVNCQMLYEYEERTTELKFAKAELEHLRLMCAQVPEK